MATTLESLLQDTINRGASDLHLVHGTPPCQRISTDIVPMSGSPIHSEAIYLLIKPYLNEFQMRHLQTEAALNMSFTMPTLGRFRMNACKAQGTLAVSIRVIPSKIFPLSSLGLPPLVTQLTEKQRGIIFITGPTGSGKSTTMAGMLDHINHNGPPGKIITIEDPIETMFKPDRSIFVQREVGVDLASFEAGIQDSMRQDPDILAIGELRSADSIKGALTAAETGHLVLTTLHTPDAAKTAQRILSVVKAEEQDIIRDQLCNSLEAVISQWLLPRADKKGLVLAVEVLLATPAVKSLIKDGKLEQIYDVLQTGARQGMISRDASIKTLFQRQLITREVAISNMRHPNMLSE